LGSKQGEIVMRVFVTGATGFVGSAVVQDLIQAGHQVLGLARSDASAAALTALGATVHRGQLEDVDSLRSGAAAADGVIHTGFIHDFSRFKENCEIDRRAIEAMGEALAGTGRHLVVTSGTALLAPGSVATEETAAPASSVIPRVSEQTALSMDGVSASVVGMARAKGVSAYVGDGQNHWPAVHRLDTGRLYRLVLEKAVAGARYHGVAEEGIAFREIAQVIGKRLGLPIVSKSPEEAEEHFGWFAHFASINNRAASAKTRQVLGWQPTHPGLIEDLDRPVYFSG
jgi:nucleoside-diphosphate-sugar epimerase